MPRVRIFWMPKDGHTTSEYEDAYAMSDPDRLPFRAAVADGATESAFSGSWARRLTGAYAGSGDLAASLTNLRDEFHRMPRRRDLPWYLKEKSAEGSHAAFAGLQIEEAWDDHRTWAAQALGDCCILHIRDDERMLSWPISDPQAFSMTPDLVSSRPSADERAILETNGDWESGDRFILATDAMAAWLLEYGAGTIDRDGFDDVVEQARREGAMRNDDVTALVIDM